MQMQGIPQCVDYVRILPEIILTVFGMIIMVLDPLLDDRSSRKTLGIIGLLGALAAIAATLYQAQYPGLAFWNMVRVDSFSIFFHFLITAIAAIVILTSYEYMEVQQIRAGEYYGLILFGAVGMCLMSSALELVLIFIALEISSISSYVLAGFRRRAAISSESSVKYFLLGSFATAFFLYGVALMFGATGSTSIPAIGAILRNGNAPVLAYAAVALMFVGLGFKVAAAPFHVWTPDVYEGAPSPVVGLMSTGPKAATFAVLLRIIFEAHAPASLWFIWIAAALSMILGNGAALIQTNVKRLLAYSSIAHAGYLLVAFAALPANGIPAAMFYTASYAAMNVGAFAVISHFGGAGERYVNLEDYAGLGRRSPVLAAILTIFLLSLIGIPMTGGFFAKFYVFSAALQANLVWLTIIGVLNSAVGAYYYLRIIVLMYMREPTVEAPVRPIPAALGVALAASLIATLYLGLLPGKVLDYASRSVAELTR
ncbi:MAG TPA: NADH-quinone oxidoreductase subunit N [Terriglobales bacterium]|jgi:NADH-quinone oxidoreductase subunit N|nr:NADH-quinone oxidoreductase subunit N [Terriglobales bacterium]